MLGRIYDKLWHFFWSPISWVAGFFLDHDWSPSVATWIAAAYIGQWPQKGRPSDKRKGEEREEFRWFGENAMNDSTRSNSAKELLEDLTDEDEGVAKALSREGHQT